MKKIYTLVLLPLIFNAEFSIADPNKNPIEMKVEIISTSKNDVSSSENTQSNEYIKNNCPDMAYHDYTFEIINEFIVNAFNPSLHITVTEEQLLKRFGNYKIVSIEERAAWVEPDDKPFNLKVELRKFKDITLKLSYAKKLKNNKTRYEVNKIILSNNNIPLAMNINIGKTSKNSIFCKLGVGSENENRMKYFTWGAVVRGEAIFYFDSNSILNKIEWEYFYID